MTSGINRESMAGPAQSSSQESLGTNPLGIPLGPYSNTILVVGIVTVLATLLVRLPTPLLD